MGGKVLELFSERLHREGRQEGMQEGKIIAYYEMNLTTQEIAIKMNLPEEKVRKVIDGFEKKIDF